MSRIPRLCLQGTLLALSLNSVGLPAQANFELGKMWTFENPPLAYLAEEYGFRPSSEWLRRVMLASLRFGGGCSASFVSPQGLIMTNHHCVRDQIAAVQGERDLVRDGFAAAGLEDEIPLPGLTVQQMIQARDVTAEVNAETTKAGMTEAEITALRAANQEAILSQAREAEPELDAEIVSLYQGAVYQLYQYRIYRDVRLVVAPHLQAAHFGGDPDNFTYPRFGIDFSFCRAYEDGKPADTSEQYFRWSHGAKNDELVFLTGNPGGTERLLTKAQLEYLRDAQLPRVKQLIDNRLEIMRGFAAQDPRIEKQLRTNILGFENAQKLYHGEHGALLDDKFMQRKDLAEAAFKQRVLENPSLTDEYGALWDEIAQVAAAKTQLESASAFQSTGGSLHLRRAVEVLRASAEGVEEAEISSVLEIPGRMDPIQAAFFVDHLRRASTALPEDDPYLQAVLDGRSPKEAAEYLSKETRIGDDSFVRELMTEGSEAIAANQDPALRIARILLPLADQNSADSAELNSREEVLGTKMGNLLFAAFGNEVSPDATFTLRFSDGRVQGYRYNGTLAPYRTVFHGLFARNAEFDNQHPFDLPELWLQRQSRLDMSAAVNFVCTVDSTGGNSGSPVINKDMEIVGLLFDGNIESMGNQYVYGQTVERSVCVHPQAIMESLTKIYDAQRIADELWGR